MDNKKSSFSFKKFRNLGLFALVLGGISLNAIEAHDLGAEPTMVASTLGKHGYSHIDIKGIYWDCAKHEKGNRYFEAIDQLGNEVEGYVCQNGQEDKIITSKKIKI